MFTTAATKTFEIMRENWNNYINTFAKLDTGIIFKIYDNKIDGRRNKLKNGNYSMRRIILLKTSIGVGGRITDRREACQRTSARWPTSIVTNRINKMYPWYTVIKITLHLCSLLQTHNFNLTRRKTPDKSQLMNILCKIPNQYSSKIK